MLHAIVHPADIQDRDGGGMMLNTLFGRFPFLTKLFADGGYQGPVFAGTVTRAMPGLSVEIVKRSDAARGLRSCRNDGSSNAASAGSDAADGWRKTSRTSTAPPWRFLRLASIRLMLRRLCKAA